MIEIIKHYWRVRRRKNWIEYHSDDDLQLVNVYIKGKPTEGEIWWKSDYPKNECEKEIKEYIKKMMKKHEITRILGTIEIEESPGEGDKKDSKKVHEAKNVVYRKPRV